MKDLKWFFISTYLLYTISFDWEMPTPNLKALETRISTMLLYIYKTQIVSTLQTLCMVNFSNGIHDDTGK